jgi:hypothetical protein
MTTRIKAGLVVACGAGLTALVLLRTPPGLNGPPFYPWAWRRLPAWPLYPAMLLAAVPVVVAQIMSWKWARVGIVLSLAMVSSFAMKIASSAFREWPPRLDIVGSIVENESATSYYTDAASIAASGVSLRGWLEAFPQIMPRLHLHSQSKPPGPILYWWVLIKIGGANPTTAKFGGLLLGAIATLSIPATYALVRSLTRDTDAAVAGACFLALCPGFVLFFPMMDPTYPLLSCALVGLWFESLRRDSWQLAIAVGAMIAITCFVTFNVLVVGLFMAAITLLPPMRMQKIVRLGAVALGSAIVLLALSYAVLNYNPIATFHSAWQNQHRLLAQHPGDRPYPATILFDLTDFAMGSGWISVLLVAFFFADRSQRTQEERIAWLVIGQLLLVAITALLQSETARVWNFMLPLLMIPIGLELSRWPGWARATCLGVLAALTAVICQNMAFIY